jgi:hypothetical protein
MCCETSESGTPGTEAAQAAELHASLLGGMHAMAQPLTLLRAHFYLAELSAAGASGAGQPMGVDAAAAVDHLCTIFRLMQALVEVQSVQARAAVTPLSRVLGLLAEDAEAVFAGWGLRLDMGPARAFAAIESGGAGDRLPGVLIDLKRTRQAMASTLHVVRECSPRDSAVMCSLSGGDGWIELGLRPEAPVAGFSMEDWDEGTRLHLALARAGMQAQQAIFILVPEPFAVSIRMPVADSLRRSG